MLAMKTIFPSFKKVRDAAAMDPSKKGRLLLEFFPSIGGNYAWDQAERFALSAEETGLILSQLSSEPRHDIELVRMPLQEEGFNSGNGPVTTDMPDKVLKLVPGDGFTVELSLDYIKDGVGGQAPAPGEAAGKVSHSALLYIHGAS